MKNNNRTIIICVILIIVSISGYFAINYFLAKDLEKTQNELNQTVEKYGYVEKESIHNLIAKFNTEIMDDDLQYPASDDYLTVQDNNYWYGLYDDIYCYIVPEKYTGDKEVDVASMIAIYYPKNSKNEELALKYLRSLIKANNTISDNEIDKLINKAKELSKRNNNAQSGKGIALALKETADYYNYQVIRIFK